MAIVCTKTAAKKRKNSLADVANTVIKERGTVLLPVFAIGRSQEVILILKQAMERKEIPEVSCLRRWDGARC